MTTDKQLQIDKRYLRMASIWSENSYSRRLKVGALLVKDLRIISDGYNGTPAGFDNNCEQVHCNCTWSNGDGVCGMHDTSRCQDFTCENAKLETKPEVLHAEANAITKVARSTNSSEGSTLYVTDSPCIECAKLIIQAGITRVVYQRQYRLTDGIDLLTKAGIAVCQIDINAQPEQQKPEKQGDTCSITWHSISEEPMEQVELVCEWESGDTTWYDVAFYHADTKTFWDGEIEEIKGVVKWAYLNELN